MEKPQVNLENVGNNLEYLGIEIEIDFQSGATLWQHHTAPVGAIWCDENLPTYYLFVCMMLGAESCSYLRGVVLENATKIERKHLDLGFFHKKGGFVKKLKTLGFSKNSGILKATPGIKNCI